MSQAIRGFFMVLVFAMVMIIQWNLDADKTGTRQLKNSLELAVHDASLALDEAQLGQGFIVFDQAQAEINFEESLQYHLKLNETLTPTTDSFYQSQVEVKLLKYFDDKTEDPNNPGTTITFPYTYTNAEYDIVDVLHGPSIVAVIETKSPRYFVGPDTVLRQAAVYEYFQ